jgi:molybdopterin molybdotransferase
VTPEPTPDTAELSWPEAQRRAAKLVDAVSVQARQQLRPLIECLGLVVTQPLSTLVDLPAFDTAAMDGWAVSGPAPWRVIGEVRAGQLPPLLAPGEAVRISTGAEAPSGSGIVRSERGHEAVGVLRAEIEPPPGHDIRARGEEVRNGEQIVPAHTRLTPPALGLLAAAGHDAIAVLPPPRVDVLVLGDELTDRGVPAPGRVRDALSPQLPGWLDAMGARLGDVERVNDTLDATVNALEQADADVVITTGGTARGPADHVRAAVHSTGGRWIVDGVRVRPGHPMKLAQLADGRALVALPGNPLAAVSGLVTLAWPLLSTLSGRSIPTGRTRTLTQSVDASPGAHRLVPARVVDGDVHPSLRRGPAMLSGISEADGLLIIEPAPHRVSVGAAVTVLPLPWSLSA